MPAAASPGVPARVSAFAAPANARRTAAAHAVARRVGRRRFCGATAGSADGMGRYIRSNICHDLLDGVNRSLQTAAPRAKRTSGAVSGSAYPGRSHQFSYDSSHPTFAAGLNPRSINRLPDIFPDAVLSAGGEKKQGAPRVHPLSWCQSPTLSPVLYSHRDWPQLLIHGPLLGPGISEHLCDMLARLL